MPVSFCTGIMATRRTSPVEQRLRDAIGLEIADGTPQIQKLIVAREIFGRELRVNPARVKPRGQDR